MKQIFRGVLVSIFIFILGMSSTVPITAKDANSSKYPIICKNGFGLAPKNASLMTADINKDGLRDLIAVYPWGGSGLYINYGKGQYYRVMRSNVQLLPQMAREGEWASISIGFSYPEYEYVDSVEPMSAENDWEGAERIVLIDGQLYCPAFLPLQTEYSTQRNLIKYDGATYKLPYLYSKTLGIYTPRYRFPSDYQITKSSNPERANVLYLELSHGKYKIEYHPDYNYFKVESFTDLNQDGCIDVVLTFKTARNYYAGLLLNCGDNSFALAGVIKNFSGDIGSQLHSRKILVDGVPFVAVFCKATNEENVLIQREVDLYLYQSKTKRFIQLTAIPDSDSSKYISLNPARFEIIKNPPLFQEEFNLTNAIKVDESAISKLIDDYEKSLINAVNSGRFLLVEKQLTPGSNLYKAQQDLVANLSKRGIQEKLIDYQVEKIETSDQANVYKVYVFEKIGVKRPGKLEFTASEYRWAYTVVFDNGKYTLSEISKWDGG